jgi:CheY-like chemotaxis protein
LCRATHQRAHAGEVILVVEDDQVVRAHTCNVIGELGYTASVAIVDVGLPDAKGDDLVRELRATYTSLPIIVASGYDLATLRERLRHLDRIGYLAKPYTLATTQGLLEDAGRDPPWIQMNPRVGAYIGVRQLLAECCKSQLDLRW